MKLNSLEDTFNLSKKIGKLLCNGDVIFLYGEIGVGKTTFVRFFINHLENKDKLKNSDILSPTFNIVYDYDVGKLKIQHYDLYRIKNCKDILQLGIFEASNNHIKIIEWPELIEPKPKNRIEIMFQYSKPIDARKVKVIGFGKWKDYKLNEI